MGRTLLIGGMDVQMRTDNRGGLLVGTVQARWPARSQEHGTEVFCRLKSWHALCWSGERASACKYQRIYVWPFG